MKARAHRELFERRAAGDESVDEKDIQKHLKDIWRLGVTLTGGETIALTGAPEKDIAAAMEKLGKLPEQQFKQVTEKTPAKLDEVMSALTKVFLKQERP